MIQLFTEMPELRNLLSLDYSKGIQLRYQFKLCGNKKSYKKISYLFFVALRTNREHISYKIYFEGKMISLNLLDVYNPPPP